MLILKFIKKTVLNPDDSYYDNQRKFYRSQDPEKAATFDSEGFFNSQSPLKGPESMMGSVTVFTDV